MLTISEAEARTCTLVDSAKRAGADAADAFYYADASIGVQVRLGALEDVERSENEEIGLRFFIGNRSASTSSSDLSVEALATLVERAAAMAREALEDPYAGLAPADRLASGPLADIDGDDGRDCSPAELKERALAIEESARSVAGVTNSEGAGVSASRAVVALATSHGFCRGYATSGYQAGVSVIAGSGGEMQRDYAMHQVRHWENLDPPETLGHLAGERAVRRLNPGQVPSGPLPIVFDPRIGHSLIGHLLSAIAGPAIASGTSFLIGKLGEEIFAPGITISDDPHRRRGLASRPFDGEGLTTNRIHLIEDGRLTSWLLDSASARQLKMTPTGHANRGAGSAPGTAATNVDLQPGTCSKAELIGDIDRGIYVTELIGQGVNAVTGDYSRGASGFLIEKGEIVAPVAQITIAGNLLDMFRQLTPASDLELRRAVNAPTLRVDGMVVAGS